VTASSPETVLRQNPPPGRRLLCIQGDTITFRLQGPEAPGQAFLRTNIGRSRLRQMEIVAAVHRRAPRLGRDWFDIPMAADGQGRHRLTLPLHAPGHFEAKALFLPAPGAEPLWPDGPNTTVNVEPADTCGANIIYNAFVRQFGPNRSGRAGNGIDAAAIDRLDGRGYTVIPPSGTFRDLMEKLDFIMGQLGCRVLQLLPIHPTPTTYARMGRFGSPYAALSFTAVDPALAVFDPAATPLEQFIELVDAVHARSGRVLLDIAVNHTGWAASLHASHPQWLVRDEKGEIERPGAWGVVWEDLTRLDYRHRDLWRYVADVFLTWCRHGVDGFRCDAGYMIPEPAWTYIIARVRRSFPGTVFLLEGLGGRLSVTDRLMDRANFNWAYSELFQNYDRGQIEAYLPKAITAGREVGTAVHFAETHDNPRLAARSAVYARLRTALCALCSDRGGFGFANGVEWLATEKIVVHEATSLNWGAADNQIDHLRRLHALLRRHPAFYQDTELTLVTAGEGNHLALLRRHRPSDRRLLVVANLDDTRPARVAWQPQAGFAGPELTDLVGGRTVTVDAGPRFPQLSLAAGQVMCLSSDPQDLALADPATGGADPGHAPQAVVRQRLRAAVLAAHVAVHGMAPLEGLDLETAARQLHEDPEAFCHDLDDDRPEDRTVTWQWPRDLRRRVMLPPGHFLLVRADRPFRARIDRGSRTLTVADSFDQAAGRHFALLGPLEPPAGLVAARLHLAVFTPAGPARRADGPLLLLPTADTAPPVPTRFSRRRIDSHPRTCLDTNAAGAMLRVPVAWGRLYSRYDALLAANLSDRYPEDRRVLLTRCRCWVVSRGYSVPLDLDCLTVFERDDNSAGWWRFTVPIGQGRTVRLDLNARLRPHANAVVLHFQRVARQTASGGVPDDQPVRLIVRPDIEDRSFHETTKAWSGPEDRWPAAVVATGDGTGFVFAPDAGRRLTVRMTPGRYTGEPEWQYMVHRPIEAQRGLEAESDLFSPGYFACDLVGGDTASLEAWVGDAPAPHAPAAAPAAAADLPAVLAAGLDHYVVRRPPFQTIIAGYPWFLDWGRDALIAARGLVAAGRSEDALAVLALFGQYERDGTLPNMISGSDAANRDTSDAPLWFFVVCADLAQALGGTDFLDTLCGRRPLRRILPAMAEALMAGTPNGVVMDPGSALLFSPAHFTWMDTDHPAGTPRQGYPVEIQALWFAALGFLARIDGGSDGRWGRLAEKVQRSVLAHFPVKRRGYLADLLPAAPGTPAAGATVDDALRPNQLLALTLNLVSATGLRRTVLRACRELLIPGAIRSLADRPVNHPLEIRHGGRLLNDPSRPYQGRYEGDEDTRRKPAYHNGTAWTWPFPLFCEAWAQTYGAAGRATARSLLASAVELLSNGCVGHVPEILDGDAPHQPRGCDAQAWGTSELLRVWQLLAGDGRNP
jgi:starch synthase (maltosyl-transferring)